MSTTPNTRMRAGVVCAIIPLVASTMFGAFRYTSLCGQSGAIQDTSECQSPLIHITLFRHSSSHAAPVSAVLTSNRIVAPHQHQWLFCQGAGNGVTCAIGSGRHIRPAVQSNGVAAVIEATQRFGE